MTFEEKKAKVAELKPIYDVFFEVLADDTGVCEDILRTILGDDKLVVEDVVVQSSKRNIFGRSVRLDALCTLGDGRKCNIEVQRVDNDDHLRRIRYNASAITTRDTEPGMHFKDITDLYVVFISESDFIGAGKTMYHVDSVLRETGEIADDGFYRILVNAEVNDGSDVSELMACFLQKNVSSDKFRNFSKRMDYLKNTESGVSAVCTVMKKYEDIAREEGRREGKQEGREEGMILGAIKTLKKLNDPNVNIAEYIKKEYGLNDKSAEHFINLAAI